MTEITRKMIKNLNGFDNVDVNICTDPDSETEVFPDDPTRTVFLYHKVAIHIQ